MNSRRPQTSVRPPVALQNIVERVPGKVSGAWVFRGTRVPVSALFQNLEGGATVAEFLQWFPGVTRQQVEAVLEPSQQSLQTDTVA